MEASTITLSAGDSDDLCFLTDADVAKMLWGVTPQQVIPSGKCVKKDMLLVMSKVRLCTRLCVSATPVEEVVSSVGVRENGDAPAKVAGKFSENLNFFMYVCVKMTLNRKMILFQKLKWNSSRIVRARHVWYSRKTKLKLASLRKKLQYYQLESANRKSVII